MESTAKEIKNFDLTVTHRDEKTGLITHTNPYTLRILPGAEGGKTQLFERPVGSGNLFNKRGEPIGRWISSSSGKGKWDAEAVHVKFIPPETEDQKLARSLNEKDSKIAELAKELEAIKADQKKKQGS